MHLKGSDVSEAYKDLIDRFLGKDKPMRFVDPHKGGFLKAHERSGRSASQPDYLPALQRELVAVISKYINIGPQDIKVNVERQDNLEMLEVKIELPDRK